MYLASPIHTVQYLNLTNTNCMDEGSIAIANALTCNKAIITLHLEFNYIGNKGICALMHALKHFNRTLQHINLAYNHFDIERITSAAHALIQNNTSTTTVQLSKHAVMDQGIACIADMLQTNTSLTSVQLSKNAITDEGIACIAEMLRTNTSLVSLDMSYNRMTRKGMDALSNAVVLRCTPIHINVTFNCMESNCCQRWNRTWTNMSNKSIVIEC